MSDIELNPTGEMLLDCMDKLERTQAKNTALVEAASSLRAAAFMVIRAVEADNKLGNRPDYVTNIDMNMDYLKKAHRWVDEALAAEQETYK